MRNLRLARKNKERDPQSWVKLYEKEIEKLIREKYSINQELAILRQRDTKPTEFQEYYEYVEKCKLEVKVDFDMF